MRRFLYAIAFVLVLQSCKGGDSSRVSSGNTNAQPKSSTTATEASAGGGWSGASIPAGDVTLRHADGSEAAVIHRSGQSIEIRAGGATFRGEPRDSGKRKYSSASGSAMFEVKPGDNGFKLRTADGKLRWKVKISPEKVKISDNEENNNPYELKARDGDRVKVVAPGERELGSVRGTSIEDAARKQLYRVEGGSSSAAYGVLLLDSIPETERYILVAEILARDK
jgi:hypothetical protein